MILNDSNSSLEKIYKGKLINFEFLNYLREFKKPNFNKRFGLNGESHKEVQMKSINEESGS